MTVTGQGVHTVVGSDTSVSTGVWRGHVLQVEVVVFAIRSIHTIVLQQREVDGASAVSATDEGDVTASAEGGGAGGNPHQ